MIAGGVAALTYGVEQIEEVGLAPSVRGPALAGTDLLCTYAAWARVHRSAAIDMSLFADSTYTIVTVASFVFGVAFSMMFLSSFLLYWASGAIRRA